MEWYISWFVDNILLILQSFDGGIYLPFPCATFHLLLTQWNSLTYVLQ